MTTKEYSRILIDLLKYEESCQGLRWDFVEDTRDYVEITAQVPTVAGKRQVSVAFTNGTVFAVIMLASGVPDISNDELTDVLVKMNNVNFTCNNLAVASIWHGENGLDFYLRGLMVGTDQDQLEDMDEEEETAALAKAVAGISKFLDAINCDGLAAGHLQKLFDLF